MDLLYFLKTRLRFIEQLYEGAVSSFAETKRKIDVGKRPTWILEILNTMTVSRPSFQNGSRLMIL